ncbi:ribosomal large subunit pseudouridine synthase A [Alteromonadaceae bacterium Bs31]|nr:ribosomal large subunit pseudouridine synthase A [Alteromonadaceae bacterium Bs31]
MLCMDIVYQDPHIIVINKPANLLTVPGLSSPDNAFDKIKHTFPNSRVVHRLDMATSGLVIFAQSYAAQRALGKLFEQRQIHKEYLAVVHGTMQALCGEIVSPMICDWERRPKQKIDWLGGKRAHTCFSVISPCTVNNLTRVLLKPITGRSHQLRLHMLQLGHPILGDQLYHFSDSQNKSSRLLLHAQQLQFKHPITDKKLNIACKATF